ncbi:MAG: type II toxin-antitoxin system VapC family toxin [Luteolibacter sp.]
MNPAFSAADFASVGAGEDEVAIKMAPGKPKLETDNRVIFSGVLGSNIFALLLSEVEHNEAVIALPRHHGDPFDRLIIAQAQVEGLTIVSFDGNFPAYGVPLLW